MSGWRDWRRRNAAARWMARALADDCGGGDRAGIDAWLRADAASRREWDAMQCVWRVSKQVPPRVEAPDPVPAAAGSSPWLRVAAVVALAVVAVLLLRQTGAWWDRPDGIVLAARNAAPVQLRYADGTTAMVDKGAAIGHRFSARSRDVRLEDGRAFFDVARDRDRPFVVHGKGASITALGTAFDVQVAGNTTTVTLVHGRVAIATRGGARNPLVLQPGQRAVIAGGRATTSEIDVRDAEAWSHRKHLLRDVTLAEAARIINRYAAKPIVIDPALGSIHSSGVFNFGDSEAFAKAVSAMEPAIRVSDDGARIRLDRAM